MEQTLLKFGVMACIFLLFNAVFLGAIFATRRKMKAVQGWSSTMGMVLASYLERRRSSNNRGSTNYPVVQYSYAINGQMYQGGRIAPGPEVGGTGAGRVVERYPVGAQVMVFYDPNNPAEAVLEKKAPAQWIMWLVLLIFDVMLCGMAVGFSFFGSTVFNGMPFFKHKGHDGHKGKTHEIKTLFPPLCPLW
jgi:hypothetical protein